jgi:hypothetical protein
MRRHGYRLIVMLLPLLSSVSLAAPGHAQDTEALRRELDTLRRQFSAVTQAYEERLKALSERVEQLQAGRSGVALPATAAPLGNSAPAPAPGTASATPPRVVPTTPPASVAVAAVASASAASEGPSVRDMLTPRQPFALSTPGRVLLFDIGVSGDFVADLTSAKAERLQLGTFPGQENRFFPREVELSLFGRVDPYASAVVRISAGEETSTNQPSSRDLSVKLDEANMTLLTLPLGTTARLGLMRPRFGTLNTVHQDDLPQVDRPNVLTQFFGPEELDGESGIEAFWVLPLPNYNELALGVFNGDNEVAFGRGTLREPLVTGRWRTFFEFEDRGGLQLDFSAASGVTSDNQRNTIVGLGAKYKWMGSGSGLPIFTLAGEALAGFRHLTAAEAGQNGDRHVDRWGAYLYGQWDFNRHWATGLRGDWTQSPTASGHEWAISPYVQFKPSEFLRFRVQYKHTEGTGSFERSVNEVLLQGSFVLGAHPTERF